MNSIDDTTFGPPFGQLAFAANRFLLDHMRRVRNVFKLDLDAAFVFGSLAHLNLYHGLNPHLRQEEVLTRNHEHRFIPVKLRDVVQVTSLPQETVRRHLVKLEEEKKIVQTEDGRWSILASAITTDMAQATLETIRKLLHTAEELKQILDAADKAYPSKEQAKI